MLCQTVPDVSVAQHHIRNKSSTAIMRQALLLLNAQRSRGDAELVCEGTGCLMQSGLMNAAQDFQAEWEFHQVAKKLFKERMMRAALEIAERPNGRPEFLPHVCFEARPPDGFLVE
eukprot:INCI9152.3.p1 GENE.INCI9152.3~~INCI9152.3.p1  ORF type:complete len:116 (-),score=22.15 INCI9152.3:326-673(-)